MERYVIEEYKGRQNKAVDFYTRCDVLYEPQEGECLFVAVESGEIIGAVRLCIEHGVHMLRTMQIRLDKRELGIGTELLKCFEKTVLEYDCFCLPYSHLEKFYGQIGFRVVDENTAPEFLQERLRTYRAKQDGNAYMIMKRPSQN